MSTIPTTKQVRNIVRRSARDLGIELKNRPDARTALTYTDRTNDTFENERQVVFYIGSPDKAYKLGLAVAIEMRRLGFHAKFGTSMGGYLRIFAILG